MLQTAYIPAKEQYNVTRAQMMATLDSLMGGRAAEELIFGTEMITSGASSDLKVFNFILHSTLSTHCKQWISQSSSFNLFRNDFVTSS